MKSDRATVTRVSNKRDRQGMCGHKQDSRMLCCLPDVRIEHVSERLQSILKMEGEWPEVLCKRDMVLWSQC